MVTSSKPTLISRHRLPQPFRTLLALLWITPPVIFVGVILARHGFTPALLDVRFCLLLALMMLPALYIWREGVDVRQDGLLTRTHVPRFYAYSSLHAWGIERRLSAQTIMIWDKQNAKVFEAQAAHLTDVERFLGSLEQTLPRREV